MSSNNGNNNTNDNNNSISIDSTGTSTFSPRGSGREFLGTVGQAFLRESDGHVSLVDETSEHQSSNTTIEVEIESESDHEASMQFQHSSSSNIPSNTRPTRSPNRTQSTPAGARSRSPLGRTSTNPSHGAITWRRSVSRPTRTGTGSAAAATAAPTRKTPGRSMSGMSGSGRHQNRHSSFVRHHAGVDDDDDDLLNLDSDEDDLEDDDFDVSQSDRTPKHTHNLMGGGGSDRGMGGSGTNMGGSGGAHTRDRRTMWKSREASVDQSVNLVDHETGNYQSKKSSGKKRGGGLGFRQKSLVDIFLHDDTERGSKVWGLGGTDSLSDLNKGYDDDYDEKRARTTRWIFIIFLFAMILTAFIFVPEIGFMDQLSKNDNEPAAAATTPAPTTSPTPAPTEPEEEAQQPEEEPAAGAVTSEEPPPPQEQEQPPPQEEEAAAAASAIGSFPPRSSNEQQLEFLVIDQDVSNPEDFQDPESAQSKALNWIVNQDPASLPIPGVEGVQVDNVLEATQQLMQRYTLAVLYFAMENGAAGATTGAGNEEGQRRHLRLTTTGNHRHLESSEEQQDNRRQFDLQWTRGSSVCIWPGVECDSKEQVTAVNASNSLLDGTLPREIFRGTALPALKSLDLSHNYLKGILPAFALDVNDGRIASDEAHNKLEKLFLQHNALQGPLDNLLDLPYLTHADLSTNRFGGTFPTEFASRLPELESCHMAMNKLEGTLPELTGMSRLARLDLEGNEFVGSIPETWSALSNLEVLTLSHCGALEGTIPSALASMPSMKYLSLQETNLEGPIPSFLGGLTLLKELYLHNTKLTGSMPVELCALRNSSTLDALTSDCSADLGTVSCECCTDCFFRR